LLRFAREKLIFLVSTYNQGITMGRGTIMMTRKYALWAGSVAVSVLLPMQMAAAYPAFNGQGDNQTDALGYYYAVSGGLFPTGTTPNGDNASGGTFRYLTHVFTDFTDDKDIVGTDPGQLDLPKAVGEVYAGLTFYFGGKKCPPATAAATADPASGPVPMTVQFDGAVTGGCPEYTYAWSFGDGGTSSDQRPSYTYQAVGDYIASLSVTDSKGNVSQSSVTVAVTCPRLTAAASGNPASGKVPMTVKFDGTATGGCPDATTTYSWDFGDGTTSTEQSPSHTYAKAGNYTASVTVTDSKGGTSQKTVSITASAENFIPTPETPVILEGINFEHDKAVLLASSMDILDRVAASLVEHPEVKVEVGGHCDADGSDAYNRRLSDRRAKAVRDYLVKKGVPATRMTAKGYGESQPIADNNTAEGKAKNRRVELKRMQ